MHGTFKPTRGTEPSLIYWTLALIVIVLFTLTTGALEVLLSDNESLRALAAAIVD